MLTEPVIGCILDGTGYGRDGELWGFEFLVGDYVDFTRIGHLQPIPLPGGEASIKHPWMITAALLYESLQERETTLKWLERLFPSQRDKFSLVLAQLDGTLPTTKASSAGRLFDGVSALLGVCTSSSYEGEAAILLGEKGSDLRFEMPHYPFDIKGGVLQFTGLVKGILQDYERGSLSKSIAVKFQRTLAEMVVAGALLARLQTGLKKVVLSGGVWNNSTLLLHTGQRLEAEGFAVYTHEKVPAGDGGIALGQAVSAVWRWQKDVSIGSRTSDSYFPRGQKGGSGLLRQSEGH